MKKNRSSSNREFQNLTIAINNAIIKNDGLIGDQKQQVDLVFSLERKFQHNIIKYQQTSQIYRKFINYIINERGNILRSRPFFREKMSVFSSGITEAMRKEDIQSLMKYHINFQLIDFIVKNWKGKLPEIPKKYYNDFLEARRILIENNLPLAINRAKLFYRKTPRSHINLLDMIDICTYGLIIGIDKYVGPYTKVWRSVCIGRMVGYMIEEYSKTFLRMYPVDKKVLYRANSLRYRLKIEDISKLTEAVNKSFERDIIEGKKVPKLPIEEVHIRTLLNGSSYISVNIKTSDGPEDEGLSIYDYHPDIVPRADELLIHHDLIKKISELSGMLTITERKIIRLKGVSL